MGAVAGKNTVFSVDDSGGVLRDLTSYTTGVSGLPGAPQLEDVTPYGSSGQKSIKTIEVTSFKAEGNWDSTPTTGPIAVLNGLRTAAATSSFEFGPEGNTTGKIKYSGECWLENLEVTSDPKSKVGWSADFRVDGVVTVGAYT